MERNFVVVGPEISRAECSILLAELQQLASRQDITGVVSFNWGLVEAISEFLSAKGINAPVLYFSDSVPVRELTKATRYVWDLARNWYKKPELRPCASKYIVDGCHWGWLDELLIADAIAQQVQHIVWVSAVLSRFDEAKFVVYSTNADFIEAFRALGGEMVVAANLIRTDKVTPDQIAGFLGRNAWRRKVHRLPRFLLHGVVGYVRRRGRRLRRGSAKQPNGRTKLWIQWHRNTEPLLRSPVLRERYNLVGWRMPREFAVDGVLRGDSQRLYWALRRAMIRVWNRLRIRHNRLSNDEAEALSAIFAYRGVSFFSNVQYLFEKVAPTRIASLRILSREIANSLESDPALVIMCSYVSPAQKLVFRHASRRNIPSLAIQHGLMTRNKLTSDIIYSDWYAAWGPKEIEEYQQVSTANQDKVRVVGSFLYDQMRSTVDAIGQCERARLELGIPPSAKVVSFYPPSGDAMWLAGIPYDAAERTISAVVSTLCSVPDLYLIMKVHPLSPLPVETFVPVRLQPSVKVLRDYNPYQIIRLSDLVVIGNSTVGLDALCLGKPIVVVDFDGLPSSYWLPYEGYDVMSFARTGDELRSVVTRLLEDDQEVQRLLANRDCFFADHLLWDGHSEQRLIELIEELGGHNAKSA